MDIPQIVKHLRDEAEGHLQQAAEHDRLRIQHLGQAARLRLHAQTLEAAASETDETGAPPAQAGTADDSAAVHLQG